MAANKVVFIDRDGTINEERGYVHQIDQFKLLPGTLEGLRHLSDKKVDIFILTNQAGIGKGLYSKDDYFKLTNYMLELFKENQINIKEVLYCPHHPEAKLTQYKIHCSCRKPKTGLLSEVVSRYKYKKQNMALIGDKNSDIECGRNFQILTYLVETGYGEKEKLSTQSNFIKANLLEAVNHLISHWHLK